MNRNYYLKDGKKFTEELKKRREDFLSKDYVSFHSFRALCDSIPVPMTTINGTINAEDSGRQYIRQHTLYEYYAVWYLLGHVEEKVVKADDIKIFSKYFNDDDADGVENFLREQFQNSRCQTEESPINSSAQPTNKLEYLSMDQDTNNVMLSKEMQWACDWWDRYKAKGVTTYQIEFMMKEKYVKIKLDYSEIDENHIMYIYKNSLPENVILLPFMNLREELHILNGNGVSVKDLVILLHGDSEDRYKTEYKKYRKTEKSIMEIEVSNSTKNVNDVKVVCNPFSLNYDYLLDLPI